MGLKANFYHRNNLLKNRMVNRFNKLHKVILMIAVDYLLCNLFHSVIRSIWMIHSARTDYVRNTFISLRKYIEPFLLRHHERHLLTSLRYVTHHVTLPVHDWSNVTKSLSTSCRFLRRRVVRVSGVFLPPATPTCGIYNGKLSVSTTVSLCLCSIRVPNFPDWQNSRIFPWFFLVFQ